MVRRCDLTYNLFGLWIQKADDVLIEENLITGKREYASSQRGNGIQLYNTKGARIYRNNISFVRCLVCGRVAPCHLQRAKSCTTAAMARTT